MALIIGFHRQVFDNTVPLYVDCYNGNDVYNRLNHKVIDRQSLLAQMAAENYTQQANEVGPAPAWWLKANDFPGEDASSRKPSAQAVTVAADLKTLSVTLAGGPLAGGDADQITITVKSGATTVSHDYTMSEKETIAHAASGIAGLAWAPFTATAASGKLTFTQGTATAAIDLLVASIV